MFQIQVVLSARQGLSKFEHVNKKAIDQWTPQGLFFFLGIQGVNIVNIRCVHVNTILQKYRNDDIPSGKLLHNYRKSPVLMENPLFQWPFSIATLNYQRVEHMHTHTHIHTLQVGMKCLHDQQSAFWVCSTFNKGDCGGSMGAPNARCCRTN